VAWPLINMSHALAHSWPAFAALRGTLGLAEGSANPARMKAASEWFPASERGLAGGVYNIGASVGTMLAPPLVAWAILFYNCQFAFVITGSLGFVWVLLWWRSISALRHIPTCVKRNACISLRDRRLLSR
jgi:ACS family hexuronate transporter-like MFS transporter